MKKILLKTALLLVQLKLKLWSIISSEKAAKKAFELFITPQRRTKGILPEIFLKAEVLQLNFNGLKVEGFRFNKGGIRKLLIVHGFESAAMNFESYIAAFIEKNFEVVAFNAPAHGNSEGKTIVIPEYISLLKIVEKELGPFDSYMAHSFGGLALAHLLEILENTAEKKAVFIAPATETTSAIDGFFKLTGLSEKVRQCFEQIILEKAGTPSSYYSIRRAAHHFKSKILWLHDENDRITPLADALKVKEDQHLNIEFQITRGLGHRKIYRDKEVTEKIIAFLGDI